VARRPIHAGVLITIKLPFWVAEVDLYDIQVAFGIRARRQAVEAVIATIASQLRDGSLQNLTALSAGHPGLDEPIQHRVRNRYMSGTRLHEQPD